MQDEIATSSKNVIKLNMDDGVFRVKDGVLIKCKEFSKSEELRIPDGVIDFEKYAVSAFFTKVLYLPTSVEIIRKSWINSASELTTLYIENPEIYMEVGCLENLRQLKEIYIGGQKIETVVTQDESVHLEKYVGKEKSYRIDDDINVINSRAFASCENLERIELSKSVNEINMWAFAGCSSLKEVVMDGQIKSIGCLAFEKCTSLQKVVLPDSLGYILGSAFEDCTGIEELTIPQSVSFIAKEAFKGWTRKQTIHAPKRLRKFKFLQEWRKGCRAKIKYY